MTPEEQDARNFFVRLADNWYGSAAGSENGWLADAPSQFAGFPGAMPATEALGYYRLDTGNPTRDAIASVLLNQLGFDNFVRAGMAREEGDWPRYIKEILGGGAELYVAFRSTGGAIAKQIVARGGRQIINSLRRAPVTRYAPTGPVTVGPAGPTVYNWPGRPGYVPGGPGPSTPIAYSTPVAQTTARTGPRPITQIRPGKVADAIADLAIRFGNAGWSGVGRRLSPSRLPGGRFGAVLSLLGVGSIAAMGLRGTEPRPTATQFREEEGQATATPDGIPLVPRDIVPTGDPVADLGNRAREDAAGIQRQYENILRELQGMYQLSETAEEQERLRFLLADIEAQRDAGLQAIAEGYQQTVGAIRARAVTAQEQTNLRAQQFGSDLEGYADRAAQRMMLQNAQMQQDARGLGAGSANPVNEWVGLMSAMAPLQQRYTQGMGDITAEGINWLGDTVSAQGQAQQADLQRLAAATRSAGIMSHQRQVSDRINRERELQRAAILQTMQQQANALRAVEDGPTLFDRNRFIREHPGYLPGEMNQVFRNMGMPDLTPGEIAQLKIENSRYYGQDAMDAARTPAGP